MSESSAPPAGRAPAGLLRASLLLLLGSAAAQAIPLLLGPLLTRLYSPEEFGRFQLFASVATNLAVLGCGRYEFALPLARDEAEAQAEAARTGPAFGYQRDAASGQREAGVRPRRHDAYCAAAL